MTMKGSDNLAFSDVVNEKDVKAGSSSEIELHVENSPESNKDEQREEHFDNEDDLDVFSSFVLRVRSGCYQFFTKRKKLLTNLFYIGVHVVLIAFFATAVVVYNNGGHKVEYWKGLGLLTVIYVLLYGGLFYYFVLKKFYGATFVKWVYKPFRRFQRRIFRMLLVKWAVAVIPIVVILVYLIQDSNRYPKKLVSFCGILTFVSFGYFFSTNPGQIKWRPVYAGFVLQFLFALMTLKWETGRAVLQYIGDEVANFLSYTNNGSSFVYGPLVGEKFVKSFDSVFAFSVLPVVFFFAFFVNILSYYNILQWFILKLAWIVQKAMGTTMCESVNAAASIFLGLTESMFLYKDHIKDLTDSELHAIMCEGLSTVAGTVLAAYISFGINPGHLISASVMSAPAALSYAKLFYPECEESKTTCKNIVLTREEGNNVLDAACKGAVTAISIVACIIANIIAIIAFMAFMDGVVNWIGILVDFPDLSFQLILAKLFIPVSFLMGVDSESIEDVALLLGTKTFVNEFRAYKLMATMKHKFSPRTEAIATFALCGFSNFGSIGILIGGISALEPSKVSNASEIAMRSFIAANIVCFITACVAGTLMDV